MRPDLIDLKMLDELYRTGSVSLAAERIGLSQPSISQRLASLRKHFGDPLFVRTSKGMRATPRVDALIPSVRHALDLFDGSFGPPPSFDPATSDRVFRICLTSVGQVMLVPRLLNRLKQVAPGVRLEVLDLGPQAERLLKAGEADLALGFTVELQSGFFQKKLLREEFVCMVRKSHPSLGRQMTRKQFTSEPQVAAIVAGTAHWILYKALEDKGIKVTIGLQVSSFLNFAQIVANTDLVALVPFHFGKLLAREGLVKLLQPPVALPPLILKQYWHERHHRDEAGRWLRELIAELFLELESGA